MKKIIPLLIVLFMASILQAAQSNYKDVPTIVTTDMQEYEELRAYYEEQSKQYLDYFDSQISDSKERSFYVSYRLYEGDFFEQIFVKVDRLVNDLYIGSITSSPIGRIKFNNGDPIQVKREDVRDWTIVGADGEEEGNYLGKFSDLYEAGLVVFISKITPANKLSGHTGKILQSSQINPTYHVG